MFEGMVFYLDNPPRVCKVIRREGFKSYCCEDHSGKFFKVSQANLEACTIPEKATNSNTVQPFTVLGSSVQEALRRYPEFFYEIRLLGKEL